ncbi:MAG: alpha-1,2-fucosyltransferase [Sodaliphilus pleomorphus]|uniref:alpha-1,2-fucosyltransferase n=1 Tax=Sodaliphilus pleomorphus TaxID=2606626 RepID=UPI0023F0DAD8|nr:alpha-1,2-fucosyltransferase [Sodaliphilus pleomorphus]MCI5981132.1 alpha-1,2-fucosyltransferase [Muribaculaceae bacterium]MDD6475343.1 alpha-1,2-fucosyltransferase [Sodaliphilus pleomorphus]MDD7066194.1 alpha-1,2-fucosyltransferase [Sodaliphilus pleomorphus]MDY2833427.1 alpha-1,2-fucosyltransferase [Sodaliphilus pleomorphus]
MNIVRINGTTAEQMFQYAFYLALHTHDDQARLDVPDGKWIQSLFRLPYFLKATPEQLARYGRGNLKSRLFSKFKKTDGIVFKEPEGWRYNKEIFDKTDTYFDGRWLSEQYFQTVAPEIRDAFSVPARVLPEQSRKMVNMLSQGKAVSVHVHNPGSKSCTCTPDYYNWAIASVLASERQAHFYVFTTHVDWVRAHIDFQGAKHEIVGYPADKETSLLPYLYHASHHIVCNTLVSWWAAWLNANPDKIVVAPDKWLPGRETPPDLVPLYWSVVPTT